MDVHRCRFIDYPPSTINALAFSHSFIQRKNTSSLVRLAIGRANGDIEIWNPLNGAWLQEIILRGGKDRSVDGLVWTQDPDEVITDAAGSKKTIIGKIRLFSIGYTTTVTEWDLERGIPARQSSGNHGDIWCLAAQPEGIDKSAESTEQKLVAGCTDGAVVVYSTEDGDLKLQRVLVKPSSRKAKVISITFQDRNFIVAGCTDSTIRIYDIRNAHLVRTISMGAGPAGGPKETIVWAVKCLPNRNIVSGDSNGEVRIWDGNTYTLIQRIKSHVQDVLSLATNNTGDTIFSGGMDRRTIRYKQVDGQSRRWAEISHQRFHSHDVKAMATFEDSKISVLISGGPDAAPIVIPLREYGLENQRMLPRLPPIPPVQSAPTRRLVMSWWDREIHIWSLSELPEAQDDNSDEEDEDRSATRSRKLVAQILIKGEANISSAALSADGNLLAVSTLAEIKVFSLRQRFSLNGPFLKVSKVKVTNSLFNTGAKLLKFSPDERWLGIVRNDNRLVMARVSTEHKKSTTSYSILTSISTLERLDRKIEKRILLGGLGAYEKTITHMSFSSDSRILAVSDLAGYIDTWVLDGEENRLQSNGLTNGQNLADDASSESSFDNYDSDEEEKKIVSILGQRWIRNPSATLLPKLSSPLVVLSFRPARHLPLTNGLTGHTGPDNSQSLLSESRKSEDRLVAVTATSKLVEFEVLKGKLSDWSRSNGMSKFPLEYQNLKDHAIGCLWDVDGERERLWLYGSNWMFMFDLSRDFHRPVSDLPLTNGLDQQNGGSANGTTSEPGQNNPSRKRKRGRGTGAGNAVPESRLNMGISRKIQMVTYDSNENHATKEIDLTARQDRDGTEMDGDEDDSEDDGGLDAYDPPVSAVVGNGENGENDDDADKGPPHWWRTYKYRPIMGIVLLLRSQTQISVIDGQEGAVKGEAGEIMKGIEVALVERPMWDGDLPPRYYGQEWEKPGLE